MDVQELLKRYALAERHFPDLELPGGNLKGVNLVHINFENPDLCSADLREARLGRANLSGLVGYLNEVLWIVRS
ncbi:MAG: pentapeptide repeat-containing protein [Anaerolineae bacterium]|nr:pentapeptide repeat-containing protein [Gloeobacterales cyanobacterium ES-bin-313]